MASPPDRSRPPELALWTFGVAAVLFLTRARLLWADGTHSWLLPFALWAGVIALGAWAARRTEGP